MKKNKNVLIGLMSVLLLIITIHVALFAKYTDGRINFFNAEDVRSNKSMESFQLILSIPLQPEPGGT
jgi:uncharacterized protein YxeA